MLLTKQTAVEKQTTPENVEQELVMIVKQLIEETGTFQSKLNTKLTKPSILETLKVKQTEAVDQFVWII